MQTASYSVSSGNRIELWRGIPAEIEIAGIENTSGDWLFLIDENWRNGSLLSGTVAASGEKLIVTLEEMNTVELAKAISSHDSLLCRATLTDKTSRVYIIPVTILNCAVSGTPTPVSEYYTKDDIDEIIAGLQPGGTSDYADLENKPQINSVTLAGNKSAAALGLMNYSGMELATLESSTILAPGKVYAFSPMEAVGMTFPTPIEGSENVFRLRITMPDPAVAVTWPAGLVWRFAIPTLAAGTTSELAFAWNGANWEGWATPDMSDYMPKSGGNFTGPVGFPMGITMRGDNSQSRIWSCNYGFNIFTGYNSSTLMQNKVIEIKSGYASTDRIDIDPQLGNLRYRGHNENTAGGFCITDATTGGLTIPGDLTFTPAGGTATTLAAVIARIEALEQAQN